MGDKYRILIDILHIRNSIHTGIGNVARDVIRGFVKYSSWDIVILTWENLEGHFDAIAGKSLEYMLVPLGQQRFLDKKLNIKRCPEFLLSEIKRRKINLVFTTCYTINSYIYPKRFNQVGYVMDLQQMKIRKLRKQYVGMIYHWAYYSLYLRLVNHILCISDATTDDVWKYCGRRARTVYINIDHVYGNKNPVKVEGMENNMPYILDVNSFMDYKNTERLIEAFAKIKNTIPHYLYLKGYGCDDKRLQELKSYTVRMGVGDRVILDIKNRTAEEMVYLFENASLFVSPSLMEGFGLTPIEAISHGCPAIVSNIKTLVEVTDHKVKSFNPYSVDSMAFAIVEAINNPPTKGELSQIATFYKERYSLEKQIKNYEKIFSEILENA